MNGATRHLKVRTWNMKKTDLHFIRDETLFHYSKLLSVSNSHTDERSYLVMQVTGIKQGNFYVDMGSGFEDILISVLYGAIAVYLIKFFELKVNESRYIALFVSSGSIKSFFELIVSIFIFSQYFFNRFFPVEKCGVTSHCLYHESLA